MPVETPLDVVCAIIVHKSAILATRRDPRRELPLLWEFPGGKIEDGESASEALHRELEEELRIRVRIVESMEPVEHREDGRFIRLIPFICRIDQENCPVPVDHVELRWIKIEESGQLTWAPADIPLVAELTESRINHE